MAGWHFGWREQYYGRVALWFARAVLWQGGPKVCERSNVSFKLGRLRAQTLVDAKFGYAREGKVLCARMGHRDCQQRILSCPVKQWLEEKERKGRTVQPLEFAARIY
eukprot:1159927-Pelagomonas_calceolata.AAC.3